ncbi:hypothetical protein Hanom_Chr15g01369201 [Helianthus anomalus]
MVDEIEANMVELEAAKEAKVCAARTVLQARIKMTDEAMDPTFDRSAGTWMDGCWPSRTLVLKLRRSRCCHWRVVQAELKSLRMELEVKLVGMMQLLVVLRKWMMMDIYA